MKHARSVVLAAFLLGTSAAGADSILIEDTTLIDGTGRPAVEGVYILLDGNRISRIQRSSISAGNNPRRIDGRGKFVMPGLMDLHVHLRGGVKLSPEGLQEQADGRRDGVRALHSYLYSGVTSIYDAGNVPDFILSLRDDERSGKLTSPRIFATGSIVTYPGSHGSNEWGTQVDSWPEAIPALDAHIARKPDILKLTYEERGWGSRPMIPLLPVDLMQQIIRYYNDRGIRTTVHASSEYRARQAIFAGIDTLAHPIIQGPITDEFAHMMAAKKVPMVTTLTIGENYSRLAEHPEYLDQRLYRATVPADQIEKLQTETREEYQERKWTWWMKIMTTIAQENLFRINAAGGVLVAGTDQSSGPALHRELELLAAAGIPAADIVRIATLNGAYFLGRERELGSIEEGKIADILILGADPTVDINNAKRIEAVIKDGEMLDLETLDLPVNR
ncbi:MAG: amidohydrolase family protein [Gammaproteobacteria bacterium]|nr:amidohydrolase family protein [Gammaproteobacteria bacterium]